MRFRRIPVPHDGDCFYHSMHKGLLVLGREAPPPQTIRRRVSRRLAAGSSRAMREGARRARAGEWAENEEVGAAAAEFGVQIRMWESANRMWVIFGQGRVVHMRNIDNVHFEPIVPARRK